MDVKDIDLGWNKIVQKLQDLTKQEVDIGIQSGEMSEDGETDMATIAAVHEFGAVIHRDAGTVTNYRKIKKDGSFAKNGRFVKKKSSNFATTASRKAHDIYIPQRSFLRATFDEKELVIGQHAEKVVDSLISDNDSYDIKKFGNFVEGLVKDKIVNGPFVPNSPATIKRKGSSRPLIDNGHLHNSVRYQIRQKGSDE